MQALHAFSVFWFETFILSNCSPTSLSARTSYQKCTKTDYFGIQQEIIVFVLMTPENSDKCFICHTVTAFKYLRVLRFSIKTQNYLNWVWTHSKLSFLLTILTQNLLHYIHFRINIFCLARYNSPSKTKLH